MNSIYLGDMDPNNNISSPLDIRRNIMYHLLFWDTIVLSDSQLLTDPRINIMMSDFDSGKLAKTYKISDLDKDKKGFESLIENGLVEIACRDSNKGQNSFNNLYNEMSCRPAKVPYLPVNSNYSFYLDSLSSCKRYYKLNNMSKRFQKNLLTGVGTKYYPNTTTIEKTLSEKFHEENINFSTLLELLKKAVPVNSNEYKRIYNYLYSCYSVNISAETSCMINTKLESVPLHLDCGIGDFNENLDQDDLEEVRNSWALNPEALDLLTFEDFVILKDNLKSALSSNEEGKNGTELIDDFISGNLDKSHLNEFYKKWNTFIFILESILKEHLQREHINNIQKIMDIDGYKIQHKTILSNGFELVLSVLGLVPGLGDLFGKLDIAKNSANYLRSLSKRKEHNKLVDKHESLEKILLPTSHIITKF